MRALSALTAAALLTACGPTTSPPRPARTPAPPPATASSPVPATPPPLPAEAEAVAAGYAVAALSYRYGSGPDAWVAAVVPWCTPAWADQLRAEVGTGGGWWADVVAHREVAEARVLAVHPAHGQGAGLAAVVVARMEVDGANPADRLAVLTVELLLTPQGWRVATAS